MSSFSDRTFGIELEMYLPRGKTRAQLAAFIAEKAGVNAYDAGYTHAVSGSWKLVQDGSLGNNRALGAEVVSPILSGESGLREAGAVAAACREFGCFVRKECGFHVHMFAGDLTVNQARNSMLNFVWFEDFFDHIMPASRRRNTNTYVNSNRARLTHTYGTDAVNRWFSKLADCTVIGPDYYSSDWRNGLINAFNGGERYWKMNWQSYSRQKTVEFRQHSGTVDAEKVTRWVRLLNAFMEKSTNCKPRPRTVTRDLTPAEEMNRFFAYLGAHCDRETKAYYVARRKALHAETVISERAEARLIANPEAEARTLVETLTARRDQAIARRHNRIAQRCNDSINALNHAMTRELANWMGSRASVVTQAVRNVQAMAILPASASPVSDALAA